MSGETIQASAFMLSLASPVLFRALCGPFKESKSKTLQLDDTSRKSFQNVMHLAAGNTISATFTGLLEMAEIADRLQMDTVLQAVMTPISRSLDLDVCAEASLDLDVCAEALNFCQNGRLPDVLRRARIIALDRFEDFAGTPGFLRLSQGALESILDDDYLIVSSEERVFEAVQRWRQHAKDHHDATMCIEADLLQHVRLPLMNAAYLRSAADAQPRGGSVCAMLLEALRVKALPAADRQGAARAAQACLGARSLEPRVGSEAEWARFLCQGDGAPGSREGAGRKIIRCRDEITCVAVHEGRVYCGTEDGAVIVWSSSTLIEERRLAGPENCGWQGPRAGPVVCFDGVALRLACWKHLLLVEYGREVWAWDLPSGTCRHKFPKLVAGINRLVMVGDELVSAYDGGHNGDLEVWSIESGRKVAACPWPVGPDSSLKCFTTACVWGRRVASGGLGRTIEVREAATGALWRRLSASGAGAGPAPDRTKVAGSKSDPVWLEALAAEGTRLYAAFRDGSMAAWAEGEAGPRLEATSGCLEDAEDSERSGQGPACFPLIVRELLPRGATLLGRCDGNRGMNEIREWDAGTLEVLRTLRLWEAELYRGPFTLSVGPGAEVWAVIGRTVVGFELRDDPGRETRGGEAAAAGMIYS